MNIESLRLAILNYQQLIAEYQLERQKLLFKSAETEQEFARQIELATRAEDGGLAAGRKIELLSEMLSRNQGEISDFDKKIHTESAKLSGLQKELDLYLKQKHLEALGDEREALSLQDKLLKKNFESITAMREARSHISQGGLLETYDGYSMLPHRGKFHIITGVNGLGKSRYLRFLARNREVQNYCQRIICLSGTMYDRFPRVSEASKYLCEYFYFGNRVNSNILSEKAPFRILSSFMLGEGCNGLAGSMAGNILEEMGFARQIRLIFSPRSKTNTLSGTIARAERTGLTLELTNTLEQSSATEENLAKLRNKEIQLHDIVFEKGLRKLGLSDLSSGERLYLLSTLALCFCVTERTLVLFDEPENSLHPQWQAKIIKDMVSIVRNMADECTVVIATHSPLIVSSAPNDISFIRDLPSVEPWMKSELYGRNADTILSEQFGLTSPRSLTVASLIQDCLTTLTDVNSEPEKFLAAADNLLDHNIQLDADDPLYDTIKRIADLREMYA
ncbi:AAA family ATPase [Pseudomonas sp. WS 5079]|uniref:AAA family ATPase n=1 Tax=Pseudomonas sp. WS 5079 TaxID=2717492 RepID=UPI001554DA14|nr:AAA family ATPase [Pseudomonas sp. WS 5079]